MNTAKLSVLLLCLICVGHTTAKKNILSELVSQVLTQISNQTLTIPEVKLGSDSNWFRDVKAGFPEGLVEEVDGDGIFGLKLTLNISRFLTTGRYGFQEIDIPGLFPIFGKGDFSVSLNEINFQLHLKAIKNFDTGKFDVDFKTFNLTLGSTKVRFDNIMNDPSLADFLNEIVSSLIPDLIKAFQQTLLDLSHGLIEYYFNEIIRCIQTEMNNLVECIRNIPAPMNAVVPFPPAVK